jgi:hypothetical protein
MRSFLKFRKIAPIIGQLLSAVKAAYQFKKIGWASFWATFNKLIWSP